ncbi:3-oxoacyl-[acyl-carrier protein] reductase [Paenibacillus sophorae]|uniref:3-ketoacyl-ACP reductase n=1 Tax=Paenibacillus sophorae TaxID=1333845 RepID=A0A1H8IGC7_9BACL|nr:3-ketoacyl-ACP reductase [Paenibacillus sophorae]QWU15957.1 3-ketoacyl-ACP reductase [Paenibacillus sophorae]SEN67594.1 3-oxoacyl-[acyl-carrier protein] reductase [Paenibacillus sophorae]
MELRGKTAVITGAGKGIGKALALALAKEGANLGLISRTAADLEALKAAITEVYDVKVSIAVADVSVREEAERAVAAIQNDLGTFDVLINNAGVANFGTLVDMDPEEWKRHIDINLFGVYYVTRAALPSMIENKAGSIINVSSTAGERGFATGSAYCASKFALMGMTEALFQEVRKFNIRVTALTPSTVNTPLAVNAGLPIGDEDRMMQPEDVAELALTALKLPDRVFIKTAGIWTTNPQ